ncbi:DUF655 domain-containing protein [Anaerococcus sp. NML200574]|uniref:DUF655 domain-containing protein n=1 Tax=unclassified Anaerococcus TaxID=2614126 RepID=UPI000D0B23D3|nr:MULTISPECIES: DUF655 domain-containing protein [unclassified Anaerococcus]MCW6678048.1 DUF655 domain-containing protein [Anaerococcus sp. NML200574]
MPKDRKDKFIFAAIIALAFLVANVFSDNSIIDKFTKKEESIIVKEPDQKNKNQKENEKDVDSDLENLDKKVYISGEVLHSGVYAIEDGDRLDDLVKKAGGLTERADINAINLALRLEDQMKIYIPNIDENQNINADNPQTLGQSQSISNQSLQAKININIASKEELMTLPNIGEKRADAIIEYRKQKRFEKIEEIKNVSGIGDKYFEAMKDLITV